MGKFEKGHRYYAPRAKQPQSPGKPSRGYSRWRQGVIKYLDDNPAKWEEFSKLAVEKALKGDKFWARMVVEQLEGKPRQAMEVAGQVQVYDPLKLLEAIEGAEREKRLKLDSIDSEYREIPISGGERIG